MSTSGRALQEVRALAVAFLYFAGWLMAFLLIKDLILAEYRVGLVGLSVALVGALVLAKVVLILDHLPLVPWVGSRPAWVGILLRTALCSAAVFLVMFAEKAFEGRHEEGGFVPAMSALFAKADGYHVVANTICVAGALFCYNALAVVREHLGPGGLANVFLAPRPDGSEEHSQGAATRL